MAANDRIFGIRERPRVAVVGEPDAEIVARYQKMFPTVWVAFGWDDLAGQVDPIELDVSVLGPNVASSSKLIRRTHNICFSKKISSLLGVIPLTTFNIESEVTTEAFELNGVPLAFDRQRKCDLAGISSVRGWASIGVSDLASDDTRLEKARRLLVENSILLTHPDKKSLGVVGGRIEEDRFQGIAWLPNSVFDRVAWVRILLEKWAERTEDLGSFGQWSRELEWTTSEERALLRQVQALEEEKATKIASLDSQIAESSWKLLELNQRTDAQLRQLLTSQGDELVSIVSFVLEKLGFIVENVDEQLDRGAPRREDLRLRIEGQNDWEAIAEVRGYSKSAGKTSDLQRLHRFRSFYRREKGREPSKSIYIVNGQFSLSPNQRQEPLESAAEDIAEFSSSGGLVVSTVDLFKAFCGPSRLAPNVLSNSLVKMTGRWQPPTP